MVIWKVINNYYRNSEFHTIPSPIPNTITPEEGDPLFLL